jgi:hypothetical protein
MELEGLDQRLWVAGGGVDGDFLVLGRGRWVMNDGER